MARRPAISAELKRQILVECEYCCAICRSKPVELAHIQPWAEVQEHKFENLIGLCPTCHTRYDHNYNETDQRTILQFKKNKAELRGMKARVDKLEAQNAGLIEDNKELKDRLDRLEALLIAQPQPSAAEQQLIKAEIKVVETAETLFEQGLTRS